MVSRDCHDHATWHASHSTNTVNMLVSQHRATSDELAIHCRTLGRTVHSMVAFHCGVYLQASVIRLLCSCIDSLVVFCASDSCYVRASATHVVDQ